MAARRKLVRLSDTQLTLASPAEDVRERAVVDDAGEQIGTVDDLIVDAGRGEPQVRFLEVGAGGVLGIGERRFLVPLDAVRRVTPDEVRIDRDTSQLQEVPDYDPALLEDESYCDNVAAWWARDPYTAPGYLEPTETRYPYDPPV